MKINIMKIIFLFDKSFPEVMNIICAGKIGDR